MPALAAPAAGPRDPAAADAPAFDPLALQDSVVIMALFYEVVREAQVARAWVRWRRQRPHQHLALWRVLLEEPAVDEHALLGIAAEIYGYEQASLDISSAAQLLRTLFASFPAVRWQAMIDRLLVPVGVDVCPDDGTPQLMLATPDPGHPATAPLIEALGVPGHVLCYAPAAPLLALLRQAFGGWWNEDGRRLADYLDERYPPAVPAPAPAAPAPEAEAVKTATMAGWLEAILVALLRDRSERAEIELREGEPAAVFLAQAEQRSPWVAPHEVPAEVVLAHVMDEVFKIAQYEPGQPLQTRLQRWIDDRLTLYELTCTTAHDGAAFSGRLDVRLVGYRETEHASRRLGPWKGR